MIGIVIVSHSARLAEGVCELATEAAQAKVCIAAAGGTEDPAHPIGTDAFKVLRAIESVFSADGVVVLMDLGSAVLSAETALEMLDEGRRAHVRLSKASLVEGAVAAAALAAAGAGFEEIASGAAPQTAAAASGAAEKLVTVQDPLGLHARPAAQLIHVARRFQSRVSIENLTAAAGPFDAGSMLGMLKLGARQGHQLLLRAEGPDATDALAAVAQAFVPVLSSPVPANPTGLAASPGIAIGPLARLRPAPVPQAARIAADPQAERHRLLEAIRSAQRETRDLCDWALRNASTNEAGIFDAQSLLLEDIAGGSRTILEEGASADFTWQEATANLIGQVGSRAADVTDVATRVLRKLTGRAALSVPFAQPSILAAHDLTPSDVAEFDRDLVLGVCLETGSASAHSVILIRALGIPAVVGLGPGISALPDGTTVAIDGESGRIWVSPSPDEVQALERRRQAWLAARSAAHAERQRPAATRDGRPIRVLANLSRDTEVPEALDCGAEGVGVLRTEFLFLGRTAAPGEEEQVAVYSAIAQALGARPLVIRTLDIGGDKGLPYIPAGEEANPFLGWRGIRLLLSRRDLFITQLRAILRAACGLPVEILFPMVSSVAELREARAVLTAAEAELEDEGVPFQRGVKVGAMIEVPSAVAVADRLAREVDAFSIGTNDLVQYTMAADRTNARVASIADPFQPAMWRLIRQAIEAGRQAGIRVTLCGELAAEPLATPVLLGLGLEEFSVSAPLIPGLKRAIARWTLPEADAVARQVMALDSCEAVREFLVKQAAS